MFFVPHSFLRFAHFLLVSCAKVHSGACDVVMASATTTTTTIELTAYRPYYYYLQINATTLLLIEFIRIAAPSVAGWVALPHSNAIVSRQSCIGFQ